MKKYIDSEGKANPFNTEQTNILTHQTIRFVLGTHFNSPPHSWDDLPYDRVMLDYMFVQLTQEKQAEAIEKQRKDQQRQYNKGNSKGGRVIRTTSDAGELEDFFERVNADMRGEEGDGR